jgi:hypothetical protein
MVFALQPKPDAFQDISSGTNSGCSIKDNYPLHEFLTALKIMDTNNIKYLLCSVSTGKIGQVKLSFTRIKGYKMIEFWKQLK